MHLDDVLRIKALRTQFIDFCKKSFCEESLEFLTEASMYKVGREEEREGTGNVLHHIVGDMREGNYSCVCHHCTSCHLL